MELATSVALAGLVDLSPSVLLHLEFTLTLLKVARLSELNRRLQQKLQVLGEERAQLNCELSELEDDDDSSPEMDEDVKASDPAPQPAQQGGWNKVVSKRTKKRNRRRNKKTQKKRGASSRSYAQATKSPPPVAVLPPSKKIHI